MDKYVMQNESPEKRLEYLKSTADQVVDETYYQRLDEPELAEKRTLFTASALKIEDFEEQKREMLEQFKEELKPLKSEFKSLASEIRTGFTEKKGKLFVFVDRETRMAYFYDEKGEMIETKTRPANADELSQTTIH